MKKDVDFTVSDVCDTTVTHARRRSIPKDYR